MHGDHVAAIGEVRKQWPAIQLHANNSGAPEKNRVREGEALAVGDLRVTPRFTPGHAEDGVTYVIESWPEDAPAAAVVGDAIFAGSMGGAPNHYQLAREKVQSAILSLSAETILCPGHGHALVRVHVYYYYYYYYYLGFSVGEAACTRAHAAYRYVKRLC